MPPPPPGGAVPPSYSLRTSYVRTRKHGWRCVVVGDVERAVGWMQGQVKPFTSAQGGLRQVMLRNEAARIQVRTARVGAGEDEK